MTFSHGEHKLHICKTILYHYLEVGSLPEIGPFDDRIQERFAGPAPRGEGQRNDEAFGYLKRVIVTPRDRCSLAATTSASAAGGHADAKRVDD